jgi:hypothetical protein
MKRPATSGARRKAAPEIKVTRNSARPQIKASRGPGGPAKRRSVAESKRAAAPRGAEAARRRVEDRRVAETRRQSLSSIGAPMPSSRKRAASSRGNAAAKPRASRATASSGGRSAARPTGGGGSVRAVAVGAGGGAAAGAVRIASEVARPVGAAARPVLRVVSGGLEMLPNAASRATPIARGRLFILLIGVLAAGLIYINVGKLEYGDGYSKYAARSSTLQRQNTALRSKIADLNAADRIQHYAERQGMKVPAPEQFTYLHDRRGDALRASRAYTAPLTSAAPGEDAPTAGTGALTGTATEATNVVGMGASAATGSGL